MHIPRWLAPIGIFLLIIAVAVAVPRAVTASRQSAAASAAALDSAKADAERAIVTQRIAELHVSAYEQAAEAAMLRAVSAEAAGRRAGRVADSAIAAYRAIAATAPDTCRAVVATADRAIATSDSTRAVLATGLQAAQEAAKGYKASTDTLLVTSHVLVASTGKLANAVGRAKADRPSLLSRIMPHVGIGAAAGLDPTGVPRVVVGPTLGWTF